jgi:hypothetical protein
MSDRSVKISELPVATTINANDLFYIVHGTNSYAITAKTLVIPASLSLTIISEGNNVIAGNGTINTAYITIDGSLYSGAKIFVDAVEGNNHSQGEVYISARGANSGITFFGNALGNNFIYLDAHSNINSGTITAYFNRQAASTANVNFRYQVTYFIL